ncbi:MAG: MarR family winged helix-turn-helix transcriptional regulator [Pontibacterium sp.]
MAKKKISSDIDYGILDSLIGYKLRLAQVNMFSIFTERCAEFDITPGLFGVLAIVERNPGLTQTAIANALGNDRSVMVSVVDRLEKMNVVQRKPSVSDRRSHALYLTDHGEALYQQLLEKVLAHEKELMNSFTKEEQTLMIDVLARIAAFRPTSS